MTSTVCSRSMLFLLACTGLSQTVLTDQRLGPVAERRVVVPVADFNEHSIVSLCKDFKQQNHAPLSKLIIATTEEDAFYDGGKATHTNYQTWHLGYLDELSRAGPFAELIVLGGAATLRVRDSSRQLSRPPMGRGDGLTVHVNESTFELVDFHSMKLRDAVPPIAPGGYVVDLYFRARNSLSITAAESLTRKILAQIGLGRETTVSIRRDTWFIEEPSFPTYYRFSDERVPTLPEYKNSQQIGCFVDGQSRVRCSGHALALGR